MLWDEIREDVEMTARNAFGVSVVLVVFALSAPSTCLFGGGRDASAAKKIKPIDMSKADVEKFMKVLPALCKLFQKIGQSASTSPQSNPQAVAQALVTNAKVGKFATTHGYASSESLMRAYAGVMSAFCYLQMKEMQRNLAQLPPSVAGAMAPQLKKAEGMMRKQKKLVTPQTIESVKPHMQAILATVKTAYSGK